MKIGNGVDRICSLTMLTAVGLDKHFPKPALWKTRPVICSVTLGKMNTQIFPVYLRATALHAP